MTGKVLKIKNVRLAFTKNLFVVGSYKDGPGKKKFRAKFIIPPDHPQIGDIVAELRRLAEEEWKDRSKAILAAIKDNDQKMAFLNGDLKQWEGFAGNYYISAANEQKPLYLRANPGTKEHPNLITQESGELYSGCYVVAHLSFWTWNQPAPQINCNLLGVQFYRPGEAFSGSGGVASTSEFGNEDPVESTVVAPGSAADMFS